MNGISELLQRYGTSLEETRKLIPELTLAFKKRKKPAIPTAPQFLTSPEAKEYGIDIEEGWMLKLAPGVKGDGLKPTLITPEKWEISDVITGKAGEVVDFSITSPEGLSYTKESYEIELAHEKPFHEVPLEPEQIFGKVFPERDALEVLTYASDNPEQFYQDVWTIGRTPEVQQMFKMMGATDEWIDKFFLLGVTIEQEIREFKEEGWLKDNVIDPLYLGGVNFISGIKQTVTSLLPALFADILPRETMMTPEGEVVTIGTGGIPHTEEMWKWRERVGSDITRDAQERFLRHVEEEEKWIAKHPELTPKPEYELNPFKHTELFKDPGYFAYTISSSLAYSLSVMGTIGVVTTATGGNVIAGIAAGMGVAGAPEASEMTKELMDMGIPFEDAVKWGFLYGAVAGGVESVTSLPLIGIFLKPVKQATKPFWDTLLKVTSNRILKATIVGGVIPTVEGLEEVVTQGAHNAIIKHYDETKSILEGMDEAFIKGVIASLPFALLGGGASFRSFKEALPPKTQTELDDLIAKFKDAGATEEEAQVMATNEIAKTPEGEQIVKDAIKETPVVPKAEAVPVTPEVTEPLPTFTKEQMAKFTELGYQADAAIRLGWLDKQGQLTELGKLIITEDLSNLSSNIRVLAKELRRAVESIKALPEGVKPPPVKPEPVKPPVTPEVTPPVAEPGMPEAGIQPSMIEEVPAKEVVPVPKAEIVQAKLDDYLKLKKYEEARATGRLAEIKKLLAVKGRLPVGQGTREDIQIELARLEAQKEVDEATSIEQLNAAIENIERELGLRALPYHGQEPNAFPDKTAKQLDEMLQVYEEARNQLLPKGALEPLPPLPDVTAKEAATNLATTGTPTLTPAQVTHTLDLFGKYITDPSPSAENAWELTRELRRETRAGRAENLKARSQQLIISEGISPEEAIRQAIRETMSGELPSARTDYLDDLTLEMRDALFGKVYHTLKEEPFEMMSTTEALTNALLGKPIPREPGVRGGSAYTRLQRVFGEQPQVFEAIEKGAKEGKSLQGVIEGLYMEVGKPPLPIDQKMADWLRNLASRPFGKGTLLEKPSDLTVSDLRTPAELEYAQRKLELGIKLAKGEITRDAYDIEVLQARDKAYPQPPIPPYEPPIDDAINQMPFFPRPGRDKIIRILKEIAWSPVDIGNFLRANKASFDMSFWRQQAPLILNHKVDFVNANVEAWKALWNQKAAEASWERITQDPLFHLYDKIGIDFLRPLELPKGTSQWRGVEEFGYLTGERTIPNLTQKIPYVKLSARAFVTGTNEHNWRIFKNHYNAMLRINEKIASGEIKLKPGESFSIEKEMTDFAKLLTDLTGRGQLGKAQELAPVLSAMFFAPRLALGRILSPRHLVSANPRIRAEAWKDLVTFVGGFGGLVLLGNLLGLWEVEKDPRNAEYMSIRIGNIRIDPWGGFRQYLVFLTRVITGTGLSSVTGAEYEVNPLTAATHFLRGKASPLAAIIADFWTGKNFIGEEVDVADKKQWIERVAPFAVWDIYEAYMEDPTRAAMVAIPAILGAGVQTYTGDWIENFPKLGLPKYSDNLPYGITEPAYDVKDFWSDTSSQFAGVDPATLTEEKGFPPYIKAIAEARIINEHLKTLPNEKLYLMNADTEKGPTFADYYQMWRDREKLVTAGDDAEWTIRELQPDGKYKDVTYKGEEAVEAFDKDERTRNAHLGNISQRQFSLLNQYHAITDGEEQAEFLEKHKDEIGINPRRNWLMSNSKENAQLAVWGQADAFTQEAYDETQRLMSEFDIPDIAIEEYLPPKEVAKTHFAYLETGEEFGWNSWETQLIKAKDHDYSEWAELDIPDTPIAALELKVKHRDLFDIISGYGDKDSLLYIEDDEAREEARDKLKADNPDWVDDMRRIEALEKNASDQTVESWVERGKVVDESTAGSSEAKIWLVDHKEVWDWALEQKLLTDDGSDWNEPVLRINAEWAEEDDKYKGMSDEGSDYYIEDEDRREEARELMKRDPGTGELTQYGKAYYRRGAYGLEGAKGEKFPEGQIENYVAYYELPAKGYRRERMLVENASFGQAMHAIAGIDLPDPKKIPVVGWDETYEKWKESFDKMWGFANHKSEHYIEDEIKRAAERYKMRYDRFGNATAFGEAEKRLDAYELFVPEALIPDFVYWYTNPSLKKPENWGYDYWYEDDWFLMEHPRFYQTMLDLKIWLKPTDFSKVPTREVFDLYKIWFDLPKGQDRRDFEAKNPKLDQWLSIKFGTKLETEKGTEAGKKEAEETERERKLREKREVERIREWIEGLK